MAGARSPCFYAEEQLWSWEWDFSEYGTEELIKLAYDIFIVSGCVAEFGIKTKVGWRLALKGPCTAETTCMDRVVPADLTLVCAVLCIRTRTRGAVALSIAAAPLLVQTAPPPSNHAPTPQPQHTPAPASPPRPPALRPSPQVLRNFLTAVASHYHTVPYHNFNHVCHVLHATMLVGGAPWHVGLWPPAVPGSRGSVVLRSLGRWRCLLATRWSYAAFRLAGACTCSPVRLRCAI